MTGKLPCIIVEKWLRRRHLLAVLCDHDQKKRFTVGVGIKIRVQSHTHHGPILQREREAKRGHESLHKFDLDAFNTNRL